MNGFMPGEECSQCKGRCCRERGCSLSPDDFIRELHRGKLKKEQAAFTQETMRDRILDLLKADDLYAIDFFSGSKGRVYYLRMRHKCYTFIGVDAMGECIALTPEGCRLSMEQRPKGGRFLKSAPDGKCVQNYTQEEMEADWSPYQQALSSIWQEYEPLFRQDGTFDRCDEAYFTWMRKQSQKQSQRRL